MLDLINTLNGWAWGPPMLILIALTGIYLTIGLKAYPLLNLRRGFVTLWAGRTASQAKFLPRPLRM